MKFLIGMIVLALGVYWGAKHGYIQGAWLGRILDFGSPASESALDQVIRKTNAKLPRMVATDIAFDKITASKQEVVFHYRFVDMTQMAVMSKYAQDLEGMQQAIVQDVCNDREIRQYVFDGGYSAQVMVRSQDAKTILNTYVRADRCR